MRYNIIRKTDVVNGPGIRVSIFMQGCAFHCKGCFNETTWDFNDGEVFDDEVIDKVLTLCEKDHIKGLSILGGEPLHPLNIEGTTKLARVFKERYPKKDLWLWTGFLFEDIKDKEVLKYIDVLVDGQFKEELHDFRLKWRGSSNQRVVNVASSLKKKSVVLYSGGN